MLDEKNAAPQGNAGDAVQNRLAKRREGQASNLARYDDLRANGGAREGIPDSQVATYLAALDGEASPRGAIKAFCSECCGYDREAVATCPAHKCPLWRYRPYQATTPEGDAHAS